MADEVNLPLPPAPKTSWTIPLLLILSIFSLSISGYLFWQNRQLMQQLAAMPVPSPSPIGSPQLSAEAADPTAGWKFYQSETFGFYFKYPQELSYIYDQLNEYRESGGPNNAMILLQNYDGISNSGDQPKDFQIVIYVANSAGQMNLPNPEGNQTQDYINGVEVIKTSTTQKWVQVPTVIFKHQPNQIAVQLSTPNSQNQRLFDQILSTFKFTE